jgi:hypothetical protein
MAPFYTVDVMGAIKGDLVGYIPDSVGIIGEVIREFDGHKYTIMPIAKHYESHRTSRPARIFPTDVHCLFIPESAFGNRPSKPKKYKLVLTYPGVKGQEHTACMHQDTDRDKLEKIKSALQSKCSNEDFYRYTIEPVDV